MALNPPNLAAYQAANNGIRKIELLLVNTGSTKATVETCELDFTWSKDDPLPWDKAQTLILPTVKWPSFVIPPSGRYPLEIAIPDDNGFSITFNLMVQMLANQNSSGQRAWPTCSGKIIY